MKLTYASMILNNKWILEQKTTVRSSAVPRRCFTLVSNLDKFQTGEDMRTKSKSSYWNHSIIVSMAFIN